MRPLQSFTLFYANNWLSRHFVPSSIHYNWSERPQSQFNFGIESKKFCFFLLLRFPFRLANSLSTESNIRRVIKHVELGRCIGASANKRMTELTNMPRFAQICETTLKKSTRIHQQQQKWNKHKTIIVATVQTWNFARKKVCRSAIKVKISLILHILNIYAVWNSWNALLQIWTHLNTIGRSHSQAFVAFVCVLCHKIIE